MRPSIASRSLTGTRTAATSGTSLAVPSARARLSTGVFVQEKLPAVLPHDLARAVLHLAQVPSCAALVISTSAAPARSAVVSGTQVEETLTPALVEWLGTVREGVKLNVPADLRRHLMCFQALVLPVSSPILLLGWIALPVPHHYRAAVRKLEPLVSDFALRLEQWQSQELLRSLQRAPNPSQPASRPLNHS